VEPLKVAEVGTYLVDIVGYTYAHEGDATVATQNIDEIFSERVEILRHEDISFTVIPVTPFNVVPITPTVGETIQPIHGVLSEAWPLPVNPVNVEVKLTNREGMDLTNIAEIFADPNNALAARIVCRSTGQESEEFPLVPSPNNPGHFVGQIENCEFDGTQDLVISVVGTLSQDYRPYDWDTEIEITRTDGPKTVFSISSVYPEANTVNRPIHSTILDGGWPLKVLPMEVEVVLVDSQGAPLADDISNILVDPDGSISAKLISPDGAESQTIFLKAAGGENSFVGKIPGFTVSGPQTLQLSMDGEYADLQYELSEPIIRVRFTRSDSLITSPAFYIGLLIFLIILIIVLVIYNILIRKNKVSGNLIFELMKDEIEVSIFSGTNKKVVKRKFFNSYPQLNLEKLIARSKPKGSKSAAADDMFAESLYEDADSPGVSVTFITKGGGRYTQDLAPHISVPYSSETDYQVRYEPNE
jgi:hypothetical protein